MPLNPVRLRSTPIPLRKPQLSQLISCNMYSFFVVKYFFFVCKVCMNALRLPLKTQFEISQLPKRAAMSSLIKHNILILYWQNYKLTKTKYKNEKPVSGLKNVQYDFLRTEPRYTFASQKWNQPNI